MVLGWIESVCVCCGVGVDSKENFAWGCCSESGRRGGWTWAGPFEAHSGTMVTVGSPCVELQYSCSKPTVVG